jgi:DNA-binding CsgD family transcriptional regulator
MVTGEDVLKGVSACATLSRRERDVLEMTSRGLTNRQVGQHLNLSVHAVKFHLASIYRKLRVSNRTEAAVVYLQSVGELPSTSTSQPS